MSTTARHSAKEGWELREALQALVRGSGGVSMQMTGWLLVTSRGE